MLLKAIPTLGPLMSPPCHQGSKGASCLRSRAFAQIGHHEPQLFSSSRPPAPWVGAWTAPSASPRYFHDFPSLRHKVIKGQSYR